MFSRYSKDLFLISVTKFTLPVSQTIFRHHGRAAGCHGILRNDLCRGIPCSDKVIQLLGTVGHPLGLVGTKGYCTDSRVIPEKSVASAGNIEGNTCLAVSMRQLQYGTLFIHMGFLILSHTKNLLIIKGFKAGCQFVIGGSQNGLHLSCRNPQRYAETVHTLPVTPILFRQQFLLLVIKADPPFCGYFGSNLTVY